jgi:hypothetical protein
MKDIHSNIKSPSRLLKIVVKFMKFSSHEPYEKNFHYYNLEFAMQH